MENETKETKLAKAVVEQYHPHLAIMFSKVRLLGTDKEIEQEWLKETLRRGEERKGKS